MSIRKSDLVDVDIIDSYELISDGYSVYLTTSVVSTDTFTKIITVNYPSDGEGLITGHDHPAEAGDIVRLVGTSDGYADGYFIIDTVLSETTFSVTSSIASSTGGNIYFIYPSGASKVGFDPTGLTKTTAHTVQKAIKDLFTLGINNIIQVGTGGDVDYTSISDAVNAAIADGVGPYNPYLIIVAPGIYFEPPMTVPPSLIIQGNNNRIGPSILVVAINPSQDLFTINNSSGIYANIQGINAIGVYDPAKAIFRINGFYTLAALFDCTAINCSNGIIVESGAYVTMQNTGTDIPGPFQNVGTLLTVDASNVLADGFLAQVFPPIISFYSTNPVQTVLYATNGAFVELSSPFISPLRIDNTQDGVVADNGSLVILFSASFNGCGNAVRIGSAGTNTKISVQGGSFTSNNINFNIQSSTGVIFESVNIDAVSNSITPGGNLTGIAQITSENLTAIVGQVVARYPTNRDANLGTFLLNFGSTGLISGGTVMAGSGLHVNVDAGTGWVARDVSYNDIQNVSWDGYLALPLVANTANYIVYEGNSDTIQSMVSLPDENDIQLAQVITDGYGIRFLHTTMQLIDRFDNHLFQYLLDTRKFRLKNGMLLSEGSSNTQISITNGNYYRGCCLLGFDGYTDAYFSYFYNFGAVEIPNQHFIDITNYDDAGTLTTLTDGYFRTDTVYVTSDGRISVIYGATEYSDIIAAHNDTGASAFAIIEETGFIVGTLVVEKNIGIVQVVDRRPTDTTGGGGGGGAVITRHGDLSGLLDDDHPQYLLVNGTRAMSGDLNMGSNDIINVGFIDGVDITAHALRHNPGGADALAVGTPVAVLAGASPSQGVAASYAISDHQHGIAVATPVSIGTSNSAGSASSVARSDHIHNHDNLPGGSLHALATTLVAGFMSPSDKTTVNNAVTTASHETLRQLIHFLDSGGPGDGFASGAVRIISPAGNPFPTSVVWFLDNTLTTKLVEKLITYNSSKIPTIIVWNMYDFDGVTIVHTITDTITYTNNVFESQRVRSIT